MPHQPELYHHRQFGIGSILTAAAIAVACGVMANSILRHRGAPLGFWLAFGFIAVVAISALLVFSRLETRVHDGAVSWAFGFGFPRYSVLLDDLRAVRPVRTGWWLGIGVNRMPGGKLYRVGGPDAVELTLADRRVLVGSDAPEQFAAAITRARRAGMN